MREYEFTFIVQPEISDEGCGAIKEKLDAVLAEQGATRLLYDDWGKRKLAYEIRKFQKGHYFLLSFLGEGKEVPDLERVARLEDSVLRYLTVQVDDDVKDIEARKAWGAEEERIQAQKQAERAAREAEEAKAREEAEKQARAEAAAAQKAADAAAAAAAESEKNSEPGAESEVAAAAPEAETTPAAPKQESTPAAPEQEATPAAPEAETAPAATEVPSSDGDESSRTEEKV